MSKFLRLRQYSLVKNIPLKGAIAHGMTSVNQSKNIYFGQSIIDAYLLQEELQYYGVVIHNTVEPFLNVYKQKIISPPIFEAKTFFKIGQITHLNIEWFEFLGKYHFENLNYSDKHAFNEVILKLRQQASGYPRKYIDNTIEMFKRFNDEQPNMNFYSNIYKQIE